MARKTISPVFLIIFIHLYPPHILISTAQVHGSKLYPSLPTFPDDDADFEGHPFPVQSTNLQQTATNTLQKNSDSFHPPVYNHNSRHPGSPNLSQRLSENLPKMYQPIDAHPSYPGNLHHRNPYHSPGSASFPHPLETNHDQHAFGKEKTTNVLGSRFRSGTARGGASINTKDSSDTKRPDMREYSPIRRGGFSFDGDSFGWDDDSDEEEDQRPCKGECTEDEFLCVGSCACIPLSFRCDGDADCTGQQDELECGEDELDKDQACLESENNIRCPRSGKCINKAWLCDGDDDCGDYSDETHCDGHNCTNLQFECNNGLCVDKSWVCDGDNDCKDNSDENNCTKRTSCTGEEFHCNDGKCISITWKCDSESDCSDGSDEADCPQETRVCNENEFECSYPRCVKNEFKCDGDDDCGDWSDEENCPEVQSTCGPAEFRCNGGRCIPEKWKCDEEIDCENGEDEENCAEKRRRTCGPDEYACKNGNCILNTWVCDNIQDCSKGEDEYNCERKCEKSQFDCSSHRVIDESESEYIYELNQPTLHCIGLKHVCDVKKDCPGGEDERNCPKPRACEIGSKCQQTCVILPNGTNGCSCGPGFTLAEDNHSCNDVDECQFEYDPVCSHMCNNTEGSFICSCMKGYVLRPDGRTCKAVGDPPTLLFANRIDIRQVSLNNMKYTAVLKDLHNAIAMDYHFLKGWIYWSDISMDVIQKSRLNGSEKSDLVKWGLKSPGGVSVDWVHDLLYWTDSGTRRIEVITLDGRYRSVIASNDLDKPRAIVTHPGEAFIFWTDWGPKPRVERAEMDGSNRKSIITESLFWPNGLALDYTMNRIYWADAKHHVIESATFEGTDRKKVITKGLPHPFAITIFEDAIYWTDWHTKSIATANKDTGLGYKVVHSGLHFPMDIHSFHSQRQPNFTDHCGNDNGGCSHLCLPNRAGFKCVCPLGLQLQGDKKTCYTEPEKLLIFARKKDIRLRPLTEDLSVRNIDMIIPIDDVQSAVALSYDADSNQIYWSDVEGHRISRSYLNGSHQEIVIDTNLVSPTGLSIDWVTKKIYWTDSGTNRIEVSNLNGTMRTILVWEALGKPRDIAVDPVGGYMYWSDWGSTPRIEKAGMDGSKRHPIISDKLTWPNGLAVDSKNKKLYWVDGGTKQIEHSNLDGSGRNSLQNTKLPHPFGLAVYENKIYWSDWETNSIYSADKATGRNRTILRDGITGLMDVRVFHRDYPRVQSACLVENGGCSHICLLSPPPKNYSCACPTGIKLLEDGVTCSSGPSASLIFAHRVDIRQISLDVPYRVDIVLPLPPMKSARSVAVDELTGDIYWSDTMDDVIMRSSSSYDRIETVTMDGLDNADGIAIDSSGRKLYWTDAGRNSIEVCELNGTNRKVLIWSDLENPRAITLHYEMGVMYWSDWGKRARIEQADMDGKNRKTLVSENLEWPNGLAVDYAAGRLYWNDGKRKIIESSDLHGQNRKMLVNDLPHPYGLVIFGDYLYWTDWKTESIHKASKYNGSTNEVVLKGLEGLMDIKLVEAKNVTENACGHENGGCTHLCLRKPNGYSCACPTGLLLRNDSKTCQKLPSTYLLFSSKTKLMRISMDTPERWDVSLRIPDIQHTISIDFHWRRRIIFFSDVQTNVIRSVCMRNFSLGRKIVSANLTMPDGLAVDWLADNIFWTDTGRKRLEVARLDGSCRKAIITRDLTEPRGIALFPKKGYLYWTDWGNTPKIERSMMDGSQRRLIVVDDLGFPNGLALDYDKKKLFWADALKDRIEVSDLDGANRVQLIPRATHPFGITVYKDYIYWTDWFKKSVERANKTTGRDRTSIRTNMDVTEIRMVARSRQEGWSPCQVKNGFCSHLCLFRYDDYICACPDIPDNRKCDKEPIRDVQIIRDEDDKEEEVTAQSVPDDNKNDVDVIHGEREIRNRKAKEAADNDRVHKLLLITLCVMCVFTVMAVLSFLGMIFHKRKSSRKRYVYEGTKNVITFSNPNYTSTGNERTGNTDKRPFLWKKLKYDRSQERVFGVREDKAEDFNLIDDRLLALARTPPGKRISSRKLRG